MEIVTQDDPNAIGQNNANLTESAARIIDGGTWKKQRVVVVVPSSQTVPAQAYLSHWCLAFPPNQPMYRYLVRGCEVGDAYSRAIDEILDHPEFRNWEYLLTIEVDNLPQPDSLVRLIRDMEQHPEYACIGGLYWTKGPGGVPQIWGDPSDPVLNFRPQAPAPGKIVECCGTGMGFNLWRMSMFRDLAEQHPDLRPWFRTHGGLAGDGIGTQDLDFWQKVRPFGYRCAVDCDCLVGHLDHEGKFGPQGLVW